MFFNEQGFLNIDDVVMNHSSFKKIMEDGIITDDELKEQAQKVESILKNIDNKYTSEQKEEILNLLAETSVLYAVYHYHSIQEMSNNL